MEYVEHVVSRFDLSSLKTLEIGSYNVNGSVRPLFRGEYIGIDHVDGPGVDRVMGAAQMDFPDAEFDVVVSTSQLEHDPTFWLTLPEVARVLRPGGHFILTSHSTGFFIHNQPDYWRFLPDTWKILMDLAGCDLVDSREDPQTPGFQITGLRG